jgi:hypothetical protein
VSQAQQRTPGKGSVLRLVLAIALPCVVVGTAFGYWAGHVPAARRSPPPGESASEPAGEPRNVVVVGPSTARLADEDRSAMRALVREELAAAKPRADAPRADRDPTSAEPPLTDAQLQAFDRARATVDSGIAHGTWTSENRAQLRMTMAQLPVERTLEIVRPLVIAVNEGKVHWEGHGPPL